MAEPTKKATPKKKLGVYVQLTAEQRAELDKIGKLDLYLPNAAGDVLRIYVNKHWDQIIGKKVADDDPEDPGLFPEK